MLNEETNQNSEGQDFPATPSPDADSSATPGDAQPDGTSQDSTPDDQASDEEFPLKGVLGVEADDMESWLSGVDESFQKTKKRLDDSQAYIKQLEQENRQLRSQYSGGQSQPFQGTQFNQQQQFPGGNYQQFPPQLPPMPDPAVDPQGFQQWLLQRDSINQQAMMQTIGQQFNQNWQQFTSSAIRQAGIQQSMQLEQEFANKHGADKLEVVKNLIRSQPWQYEVDPQTGQMIYADPRVLNDALKLVEGSRSKSDYKKIAEAFKKKAKMGTPVGGGAGGGVDKDAFQARRAKLLNSDIDTHESIMADIEKELSKTL